MKKVDFALKADDVQQKHVDLENERVAIVERTLFAFLITVVGKFRRSVSKFQASNNQFCSSFAAILLRTNKILLNPRKMLF